MGRGSIVEKPGERAAAYGPTVEQTKVSDTVTSKSPGPASFEILQCDLFCPRPGGSVARFPLEDMFVELSIFEDLYSNVLRGAITLRDTGGNLESMPIIGEETLKISAYTKGSDLLPNSPSEKSQYIENDFRVTSIGNIVEEKDRVKLYTLNLVSPEYILNLSRKVQRSFPNSGDAGMLISDMIYKIFNENLIGNSGNVRLFNVEQTKGLHKISISNMTPFGAINFLASRSISEINPDGALFFFYETFRDGFRFESIETLFEQDLRATYVYSPQNIGEDAGINLYIAEFPEQISSFDVVSNAIAGMYNSRLIAHDIVRIKYSILDYNYVPQAAETTSTEYDGDCNSISVTETNPDAGSDENYPKHQTRSVINDTFNHLDNTSGFGNRLVTDDLDISAAPKRKYNPSVIRMFPTNNEHDILFNGTETGIKKGGGVSEPNIKTNQVEKWMLQRPAQLQMLNNIQIRFTVAGDTTRHVGDVVNFEMHSHLRDDTNQLYDGKYLVTQIRHRFGTNEFKTEMQLSKESFNTKMDMQKRSPENSLTEEEFMEQTAAEGGYLT